MARKKKPVDDTPICDPAYLRRIDSIWMPGPVPMYFWEDQTHRRDYLLWLADRLGLRAMVDFYRLEFSITYRRNHGSGLIKYWGTVALAAVQDCFPEYDWKPWLFPMVPQGFWESPANRRSYLIWLGEELGFHRPEAWYQIESKDLVYRCGGALLQRYASLYDLMREFLPELDWDRVDVHRPLEVEQILAWADAYHSRQGRWPTTRSGRIAEGGLTWAAINACLRDGRRGLPGGTSLARFLEKNRALCFGRKPPPLSEEQILAWADAYFAEKGKWPGHASGAIPGTRENWSAVQNALIQGGRGLQGNSSLAQLLAERREKRNHMRLSPLTEEQILTWADTYFAAQGRWPTRCSGPIAGSEESWSAVDAALRYGYRSLRPGVSLLQLLAARRRARTRARPPLTEQQVLAWADAHFATHGNWPNKNSGPIPGAGENWSAVDSAMRNGNRGLRRRSSLAQLLARQRGVRNGLGLPPLAEKQILAWADRHFAAQGEWPSARSGAIAGTQETWSAVASALRAGMRGLPGDTSLAQLLAKRRGKRNHARLPPLKESKILAWAWRYFQTESRWPSQQSGAIAQSPGDTWRGVDTALRTGLRGLPGGSSLAKLLRERGLK